MTDLLVRNIPDDLKTQLAVRAAENGRSQSTEAVAILKEALQPQKKSLFEILRETAEVGGFDIERPAWAAREFTFDGE